MKPAVFWADLEQAEIAKRPGVKSIDVLVSETLAGDISATFQKTEPIAWDKRRSATLRKPTRREIRS